MKLDKAVVYIVAALIFDAYTRMKFKNAKLLGSVRNLFYYARKRELLKEVANAGLSP